MFLEEHQKKNFDILPARKQVSEGKMNFPTRKLISNIFPVNMNKFSLDASIYSYYIKTQPEIPADSGELLKEVAKQMPNEFKKKIGFICSAGIMVWGSRQCDQISSSYVFIPNRGQSKGKQFSVILLPSQQSKFLDWREMIITNEGINHAQHILQQLLQRKLHKDLSCVGNGFYFERNRYKDSGDCSIYKGYKLTPLINSEKVFIKIDPTFRVIRHETFYDTLKKDNNPECYVGKSLTTNYGNHRNYKIEEIDLSLTPANYKIVTKDREFTCCEYFAEKYGERITKFDQPLVRCQGFIKEYKLKGGEKVREKVSVYLVPELCTLANVETINPSTLDVMRLSPYDRLKESKSIIKYINNKEDLFEIESQPMNINAMILPRPSVLMHPNSKPEYKGDMLMINSNTKLLEPGCLNQILYVYPETIKNMVERIDNLLVEIGQGFGTQFKIDYNAVVVKKWQLRKVEEWKKEIKKQMQKNQHYDIVIVILEKGNTKFKHELKRTISEDYKVVSQFLNADNLNKKSGTIKSIMSKVVMQILSKVGFKIWEVSLKDIISPKYVPTIGALSVRKERGNSLNYKFVGARNQTLNSYFNINAKVKNPKEEKVGKLTTIFSKWIDEYQANNKKRPNLLVLYRDGLNLEQVLTQVNDEIGALKEAIALKQNYAPEIVYVVACNRENTRFYTKKGDAVLNCEAGTVYIDNNFNDGAYEFYMQSHSVFRACAHPVYYRVVLNESKLSQKELISLTHSQCYNYFNWAGAGKVPGCLQYNKKLSRFLMDTNSDLENSPQLYNLPHYL